MKLLKVIVLVICLSLIEYHIANSQSTHSPEFGWTQIPVEKYKYFRNEDKSTRREFSAVGKLFVTFSHNSIEFVGIEYVKGDDLKYLEPHNKSFDFVFSEYEIERTITVDDSHFKFEGYEKSSFRRIEGFIKTRKIDLSTCQVLEFELSEYFSDNKSLFNHFKLVSSEAAKNIIEQFPEIYFGDRKARCY